MKERIPNGAAFALGLMDAWRGGDEVVGLHKPTAPPLVIIDEGVIEILQSARNRIKKGDE